MSLDVSRIPWRMRGSCRIVFGSEAQHGIDLDGHGMGYLLQAWQWGVPVLPVRRVGVQTSARSKQSQDISVIVRNV